MKKVEIYTDGGCRGNGKENSIGGYGAVLIYNGRIKEIKKGFRGTTNNIMELTAVIDALEMLNEPCDVVLYSDSAYVVNSINNKWIDNWINNDWKTSNNKDVKNIDLWFKLITLLKRHKVQFVKVKGHSDNKYNNRCDELANKAMDVLSIGYKEVV